MWEGLTRWQGVGPCVTAAVRVYFRVIIWYCDIDCRTMIALCYAMYAV